MASGVSAAAAPLRIGIDACSWLNDRGYGRFTREVVGAMVALFPEVEFVLFADRWAQERITLAASNVTVVGVEQAAAPTRAASADGNRSPLDMLRLTRAIARQPLDVFFSPSVYTYFPLPPGLRAVVTIHDAIAERFPALTLPTWRARLFWNAKVRLAVWQARLVLTVSDYSARDMVSVLGIPARRVRVTSEAPSPAYFPSESRDQVDAAARAIGIPAGARWIVYVGGFNPHKHVDLIVKAHAACQGLAGPPLYLVLVGDAARDVFHGDVDRIRSTIVEAGTGERVLWPGFVADDQLRHLHSGAVALMLPSECEGFGLPAVEAAACGTPVIATTESPLPDLLEGGGLFVAPGDHDALRGALRRLLEDEELRRRLGAGARERAAGLTWEKSARLTMQALREAAA